jgi:hypothetical protein
VGDGECWCRSSSFELLETVEGENLGVGGVSTGFIHRKICAGERDVEPPTAHTQPRAAATRGGGGPPASGTAAQPPAAANAQYDQLWHGQAFVAEAAVPAAPVTPAAPAAPVATAGHDAHASAEGGAPAAPVAQLHVVQDELAKCDERLAEARTIVSRLETDRAALLDHSKHLDALLQGLHDADRAPSQMDKEAELLSRLRRAVEERR